MPASDNTKKRKKKKKNFSKKGNPVPLQLSVNRWGFTQLLPTELSWIAENGDFFLLAALWSSVIFESMVHPKRKPTKVNRGSRQRQEYLVETKLSSMATSGSSHDLPTQLSGGKGRSGLGGSSLSQHGEHLETKASKQVVFKLCSVNPGEPQGRTQGKQTSSRPPHRSPQHLFVGFTYLPFIYIQRNELNEKSPTAK